MHHALHVPYFYYFVLAFAVIIRVLKRSVPLAMSGTTNLGPGRLRSQDSRL